MPQQKSSSRLIIAAVATLTLALVVTSPTRASAQTFQTVPALAFTKTFAGAEPLPQILTIAYTNNSTVRFSVAASTNSGGSWLTVSPGGTACCYTPLAVEAGVNAGTLAAGTYTGQIVITNYSTPAVNMTIPVTLQIKASSATFFDDLPGKLSFSLPPGSNATPQSVSIRNAGAGTLSWTLTTSTADGGSWIAASASSGVAPATITVGITTANLPGGGSVAGTYVGQLVFQTSADSITVPIAVNVGDPVFEQINPLYFTMPFGGANPVPQILDVETTDNSAIRYSASVRTARGGNWLSISPSGTACCYTPLAHSVSISASTLAAGAYTGEIIITEYANPQRVMVVPVNLTVAGSGTFFSDVPGALTFSLVTHGTSVTPQPIRIGNAGSGTLAWMLASNTSDGGDWLTGTPSSGTAPATVSIGVDPTQLPDGGNVPGTYVGQVVLQTAGDTTTIPVAVTVGSAPFTQMNPISFTMPFGGPNPLPQILNAATLDNSTVRFSVSVATGTGGNWLAASPAGTACCYTPLAIGASVINATSLAAGTYTGELIFTEYANPQRSMVVPVNLTILSSGAFFSDLPGSLSFSMKTDGVVTPQIIQVFNGGTGTLNWTLGITTADGGNWLSASIVSGTAPSRVTIGVDKTLLPGGGALPGTYVGQLAFQTAGDVTTIPVTVTVNDAGFTQVNPIAFAMPFGGPNPLPQLITIATSDNSTERFSVSAITSRGGNWLQVSPSGTACCYTPLALGLSINAATLPAGTYTGEIVVTQYSNPQRWMSVPVTLAIVGSGSFFDNLPGQMNFSMKAGGKAAQQTLQLANGGTGKLVYTLTSTTADGGLWLSALPLSGTITTTPKAITVKIVPAQLPGAGHIPGTYVGQLLFQSPSGTATVSVIVTVGTAVFDQVEPLNFVMPAGGANPLPQLVTLAASDQSAIRFSVSSATGKGGNWLQLSTTGTACCYTPFPLRVGLAASSLPVGVYTGEINIVQYANPGESMTVPVRLTVVAASKPFFDNLPGQMSFSFTPSQVNPPTQTVSVANAGAGTLNWTVAPTTADSGTWLKMTPVKGTNTGTYTVTVTAKNLPGKGLVPGTYIGQQTVKTTSGNVTIPTVVTVGNPVFVQPAALTFTTTVGSDPAPQGLPINSTGSALRFTPIAASAKGGKWLTVSPSGTACCFTGSSLTVTVNTSGLSAGTYVGEIDIIEYSNPAESMTVPVVLTIKP
jgi:hypothetical protein